MQQATTHKYKVITETKGTLLFHELPDNIYIGGGFQNKSDKGKIFWFGFDNGTCLIPFMDMNGNDIYADTNVEE